ncbi:DUF6204 family protein [Paractinoplanes atraurantiacus]|uniref:Uncharacterized protein n=1 Tax=Paractinoplanes atraurantiacus TaxID=1036182 RepID=A0A285IB76_9ACTN|nr:DUF6204 family protein [Actinoplanes atraurantiacus]SNY45229.1 hypothetical protein SAMN05421748_107192 [Actinoplanes atraurantiacus]
MSRTIRVTVRGSFDNLTDAQLAELVAAQGAHDFLHTQYTPEGHLTYDLPARPFFTFRFAEQAADDADVPKAAARAEAKAASWMAARGYAIKKVTSQTVDVAEIPLGKRGKREAARKG